MKDTIINKTINFVKTTLENAEGGHDWFHVERVYKIAKTIAIKEKADLFIIELAALLHDIADSKFYNGDESIGPKMAKNFMDMHKINSEIQAHVLAIIKNISFKNSFDKNTFISLEYKIVQDADRLDSIGAIGIARAFNYGGFKNRGLYNPEIIPNLNLTKEEYKKSAAPTINHFYEKLLLLKDLMNTKTGKEMAEKRHLFMEEYLNQFYSEWEGKA